MVGREVDSINYKDDFCLKSESDIIIADEAREFLEAAAMSCTEKREFFINVKLFFQTGIKYIQEKLPWNEETLFHLEVTDMGCGDRSSSLRFLLEKFPCLTPGGKVFEDSTIIFFFNFQPAPSFLIISVTLKILTVHTQNLKFKSVLYYIVQFHFSTN